MRKRTAVIAAVAVVAIGGGVAYAAWSSTGSGSGTVSSTTSQNSSITPVSGSGLYPGVTVDAVVSINNPNDYAVKVNSIADSSSSVNGTCAAGTVTTTSATTDFSPVIAAHGTQNYTLKAKMNADASDGCKSITFTVPLNAQLVSAAS
ncbi:hypothetical protein ABZX92_34830 [Lentzea sp. NPDC006480]|uniref:hypothetical protein n=1 Tax=Lentzea sp. NPDC006480 TaxID=3157176 RepID=UPI0033A50C54